jgi:hypothetical protein
MDVGVKNLLGSPLALPKTKVGVLSDTRSHTAQPNFGLGAGGAQVLFAFQVLLNYDLPPWTCHLHCVCFGERFNKYSEEVAPTCNVQRHRKQVHPLGSDTFGGISMQCATTAGFELQIVEFASLCDEDLCDSTLDRRSRVYGCCQSSTTKP